LKVKFDSLIFYKPVTGKVTSALYKRVDVWCKSTWGFVDSTPEALMMNQTVAPVIVRKSESDYYIRLIWVAPRIKSLVPDHFQGW